jgi:hypothetical protein
VHLPTLAVVSTALAFAACGPAPVDDLSTLSRAQRITGPDDRPDHRCGSAVGGARCGENRFCTPYNWCYDVKLAAPDLYDGGPDEVIERVISLPCVRAGGTFSTGQFQVLPDHYQRTFLVGPNVGGTETACYEDEIRPMFWESIEPGPSGPAGINAIMLVLRTTR